MIDPVYEQVLRDAALVRELGLTLIATLETHVHADHVTAAWQLKRRLGSAVMIGAASGAVLVLYIGVAVALASVLALLLVTVVSVFRFYTSEEAWTANG